MKKIAIVICLLLSLSLTGSLFGTVLIDLDASGLPEGDLTSWVNAGAAGGTFMTADREGDDVTDPNAVVKTIDGKKCIYFADGAWMESDITTPAAITGANSPWSVLIVADANSIAATAEDSMFQWADRGFDGGNTAHFNFGTRALTFWNDVFYTNPPAADEWVHLAATYDGTNVRVYVNGLPDTVAARSLDMADGDYMRIARAMPDVYGTHPFYGGIASIQMHDVALSRSEIHDAMGEFVEAGELGPSGLSLMEGNGAGTLTLQILPNNLTDAGPTTDLEVTLSFAGTYTDAALGTSAAGEPYVVTVPAANYSDPINIDIVPVDDDIREPSHNVLIEAVVTAGDPAYQEAAILPIGGLAVAILDNDYAQCPTVFNDGAYIDDFDCPWDFKQGVTGFWDGILNAQNIEYAETVTTPGLLTIDGTGNWNGNENTGPFIYTEVTGDFVAEYHQMLPVTSIGGLMVRLGGDLGLGGPGEDNMLLAAWSSWDVGSIFWPTDDGGRQELDITWEGVIAHTYARVERRGADFYWSRSYDGVVWEPLPSANPMERPDLDVATLQVGLVQAFSGEPVEYDYFKLWPSRGSISGELYLAESIGESGTVQLQLDAEGFPPPSVDIDVTVSAVAAAGADPNSEPSDIAIGTSSQTEPYTFTIPAANYDQPQMIDIAAVIDADPEPDQLLTLSVDIVSADPNWNGLLITPDVLINVMEEPGILIDEGDGVEVTENGAVDAFTVRLKTMPTADVMVAIADDADPCEVTVPASLSFTDADFMTPQTVNVAAVDDDDLETDPHGTTLTLTTSNGAEYDAAPDGSVAVSLLENECGAWGYSWADFDLDCDVDIADLVMMAGAWLDCSNPYAPGCTDWR